MIYKDSQEFFKQVFDSETSIDRQNYQKNKEYDVVVIGSGLASLSSACYLAKSGKKVLVIEKNEQLGGRLSVFQDSGFVFDMGPSWIWMKDVFEAFFADFGESFEDLKPIALNPQFRMFFGDRFVEDKLVNGRMANLDSIANSDKFGSENFQEKSKFLNKQNTSETRLETNSFETDPKITSKNSSDKQNTNIPINYLDLPNLLEETFELFESMEKGGAEKLKNFLKHSNYTYKKGVLDYMQRRSESFWEFLNPEFLTGVLRAGLLKSYAGEIDRQFENPKIQEILNFPVLFLGATPQKTPYLYSLMADTMLCGGTHYIQGGMNLLIQKIIKIADRLGVDFLLNHALTEIKTHNNSPKSITLKPSKDTFYNSTNSSLENLSFSDNHLSNFPEGLSKNKLSKNFSSEDTNSENANKSLEKEVESVVENDFETKELAIPVKSLILGLDYQHGESLLPKEYQRYDTKYWQNRVMAPSCLLYYLGFDTKIPGLKHHNLFFDTEFDTHASDIYEKPKLPKDPLFYVCCPSQTDPLVCPEGCENLFVLVPIATNLEVSQESQENYLAQIFDRMQKNLNLDFQLRDRLIIKHFFGPSEFVSRYNSWGGNGYGLANTLAQTAIFKPKMRSKLKKTYFAGQLTIPGPGMPPCLISGRIASEMLIEELSKNQ